MRWHKRKSLQVGASLAVLAMVVVGCSSSSKNSTGNTSGGGTSGGGGGSGTCSWAPGVQAYQGENTGGTPKTGGVLTALGVSDVDEALDLNIGYLTYDYSAYDLYNRSLYNTPSVHCQQDTLVPDLATAPPKFSSDGLHATVTIRTGAMWDSTPPRQVTAADEILGVKRSCNPTSPFGGQGDFNDVIAGYKDFCTGFGNVSSTSVAAQKAYIDSHQISGVQVDPSDPLTIDFTLLKPAAYLEGFLSLPPFNPAPQEILQALPASANAWKYVMSDGPYKIASYDPGKTIDFVRNSAWNASSDPLRKAYVDEIKIDETGNEQGIYQQVLTNSASADLEWSTGVPPTAIPGLLSAKDPHLSMITSGGPEYVVWNTASPNNNKALGNPAVRQALNYAINRALIQQDNGGPQIAPAITHVIAPPTLGSTPNFDLYPYDPNKAKQMLAAAGASNLTLKFLYYSSAIGLAKDAQTLQSVLGQIGVKVVPVAVNETDFYTKYLYKPAVTQGGGWDFAEAGWIPDWFPDGDKTYFLPLLSSLTLPPNSSNYGFFKDPKLDSLVQQALTAPNDNAAGPLWHQADMEAMQQAAWFPTYIENYAKVQGTQVHNCIIAPNLESCDMANVWLSR